MARAVSVLRFPALTSPVLDRGTEIGCKIEPTGLLVSSDDFREPRFVDGYLTVVEAVDLCGVDVLADPLGVRKRIGYLPEVLPLYMDMEVRSYLEFVARKESRRTEYFRPIQSIPKAPVEDSADDFVTDSAAE